MCKYFAAVSSNFSKTIYESEASRKNTFTMLAWLSCTTSITNVPLWLKRIRECTCARIHSRSPAFGLIALQVHNMYVYTYMHIYTHMYYIYIYTRVVYIWIILRVSTPNIRVYRAIFMIYFALPRPARCFTFSNRRRRRALFTHRRESRLIYAKC